MLERILEFVHIKMEVTYHNRLSLTKSQHPLVLLVAESKEKVSPIRGNPSRPGISSLLFVARFQALEAKYVSPIERNKTKIMS